MTSIDIKDITCFLCNNIYNDPVALECCHSFCSGCITNCNYMYEQEYEDILCPICYQRSTITVQNTEIVDLLKSIDVSSLQITQESYQEYNDDREESIENLNKTETIENLSVNESDEDEVLFVSESSRFEFNSNLEPENDITNQVYKFVNSNDYTKEVKKRAIIENKRAALHQILFNNEADACRKLISNKDLRYFFGFLFETNLKPTRMRYKKPRYRLFASKKRGSYCSKNDLCYECHIYAILLAQKYVGSPCHDQLRLARPCCKK